MTCNVCHSISRFKKGLDKSKGNGCINKQYKGQARMLLLTSPIPEWWMQESAREHTADRGQAPVLSLISTSFGHCWRGQI